MKAKSRKHLLISSIAMLLVATVALGAATYAWFTSSTTATASGINVRTVQASELEISDYTKGWGTEVNYEITDKILLPASSSNGSEWWQATAGSKDAFDRTGDFIAADAPEFNNAASSNFVYKDQLNVRNNGDATVEDVTISWTIPNSTSANYIRVALVPANDAQGTESPGAFASAIYDNDGVEYEAASGATTTQPITPKTDCSVPVGGDGEVAADEVFYYNLYIWFEGQDAQCFDGNAGQIINDIEFTVSGTTADQV